MKNVIILGASGSIGKQSIDIVKRYPDRFRLVGVSVGKNIEYLRELLAEMPDIRYVCTQEVQPELMFEYPDISFYHGDEGLNVLAGKDELELLINALVGFVGFVPSCHALKKGKDIALANKETLVAGGEIIKDLLKKYDGHLYPIDSEHSAIWQCLHGNRKEDLNRLIITASGGSFRDLKREELIHVTKEDALKHPTWSMGAKITIDSSTMMNKGFEIMEAHYLFDVDYEKIDVVLHDESIIHSLIEFKDGAQLAQMGQPDMRVPIQYALLYPEHASGFKEDTLDLAKVGTLHFRDMDYLRYPLVKAVKDIAPYGGNFGAVLNGANDTAVELFLNDQISFMAIEESVFGALRAMQFIHHPTMEDIVESYRFGRQFVYEMWK